MDLQAAQTYTTLRRLSFRVASESIDIVSKPGLPEWDQLLPANELLARYPLLPPNARVMLMGCHHGALGVFLARRLPSGHLFITDHDGIALHLAEKTLQANSIESVNIIRDIHLPDLSEPVYDAVLIQIPKGRQLTRRWLVQAHQALVDGGELFIAGANKAGIQSSIKDAQELFGQVHILGYKKGNRLARLVKKSPATYLPDWAKMPGIAPRTWVEFSIQWKEHNFPIHSLPGVFSFDHLDPGTEMLLGVVEVPPGSRVLDVGCGYGMIALVAAACGAAWVDCVDSDLLAVASCRETLYINNIQHASVFAGDLLEPVASKKYDLILSNPPFHAGRAVDYQIAAALIYQSYQALNPAGCLMLVANRFLPYDRLLQEAFGNVTFPAKSAKFHVISAVKST